MSDQVLDRPKTLTPLPAGPLTNGVTRDTARPAALRRPVLSRRRLLLAAAGLLGAIGIGWYGHGWWTVGRFLETTDDAYVGGEITVVAPKVSGFIDTLMVTDNQFVHAGDLLLRLDDRDERAALDKAEADVAAQRATLSNIAANRVLQLAVIAEAKAELGATAAGIALTRYDVDRYRALSNDRFASLQRFQQADTDARRALAADLKARAVLQATISRLAVFDTQTGQTEAALQSALAERETARLNLGYTELRAPLDGIIGNRSARLGAFSAVNSQLLAIVPAHGLWVDANFKEDQLTHMRPGLPVTISADVLPGVVIHGHIESLAPATGAEFSVLPAENATGNFTKIVQRVPVRVRLDENGPSDRRHLDLLRPGLSVTASVDERPAAAGAR